MKFNKLNRYGKPVWFNGIYKIVKYDYSFKRGSWGHTHYHCFIAVNQGKQWGDYVDRGAQKGNELTFKQCAALCAKHAKAYTPTPRELANAANSQAGYVNSEDKWGRPLAA